MRSRGWTSDVLRCVRELGKSEFTLGEMYGFEGVEGASSEEQAYQAEDQAAVADSER